MNTNKKSIRHFTTINEIIRKISILWLTIISAFPSRTLPILPSKCFWKQFSPCCLSENWLGKRRSINDVLLFRFCPSIVSKQVCFRQSLFPNPACSLFYLLICPRSRIRYCHIVCTDPAYWGTVVGKGYTRCTRNQLVCIYYGGIMMRIIFR